LGKLGHGAIKKAIMKKLLTIMKPMHSETPEAFTQRVWASLKERGLVNEQGKLKLPPKPKEADKN